MTTPDQIRFAYSSTLQCSNGLLIEDCLKNERGLQSSTVCDILKYLRFEKSLFGMHILSKSDGAFSFLVLYKMGKFEIIVQQFYCFEKYPFSTIESFAKWLNDCERKILEAAGNLTFDTFEKEINGS